MRAVGTVVSGGVVGTAAPALPMEERESRDVVRARMEAKRARAAASSPFAGLPTAGAAAAYGTRSTEDPALAAAKYTTPDLEPDDDVDEPAGIETLERPKAVRKPHEAVPDETSPALAAEPVPTLAAHPDVRAFLTALQDALDTSAEVVMADVRNATDRLRARAVANRRTAAASRGRAS